VTIVDEKIHIFGAPGWGTSTMGESINTVMNVMKHRFGDMTFSQMRESIAVYGADAFKDATGWGIVFDNPDETLSVADPYVLARLFGVELNMETIRSSG